MTVKIVSCLINTNVLIALSAVALAVATQASLGLPGLFHPYLALILFATLFDYTLHRLIGLQKLTKYSVPEKFSWAKEHSLLLKVILVISFFATTFSLLFVNFQIRSIVFVVAAPTILYSFIILRNENSIFNFKKILGIKSFLLAFVWAIVTVIIPFSDSLSQTLNNHIILLFLERFAFIFAIAILFDIRDIKQDSQTEIKTFPVYFGESKTLLISNILFLLLLLTVLLHNIYLELFSVATAYFVSIIWLLFLINNKQLRAKKYFYTGFIDGSIFIHGFLIYISHIIQF